MENRIKISHFKFENWPNDDPFSIQQIGEEHFADFTVKRKNSESYVMAYIFSGVLTVNDRGVDFIAEAGDTVFLKRHTSHLYYSSGGEGVHWIQTTFCGKYFDALCQVLKTEGGCVFKNTDIGNQLRKMLEYSKSNQPLFNKIAYCCGKLSEALYILSEKRSQYYPYENGISFVKVVIDRHLDIFYSNRRLAEFMRMSESSMVRKFKDAYGITPQSYQENVKLDAAKQRLETTDLSVKEISAAFGFCDATYFSTRFKKRFGISPKQVRLK